MNISRSVVFGVLMLFAAQSVQSQSVFGKWKTIDDRTGKPKAIVDVYEENGLMYGKLIKIVEEGKENFICEKCKGELKGKPALGMLIIDAAEHQGDGVYKGDTLFDPQQAMTFRCKVWLNPDNSDELKVRGYLAFIYRTQTWVRIEG